MKKFLIISCLALSACDNAEPKRPTIDINGYKLEVDIESVRVNEVVWRMMGLNNYPFTQDGDITCFNNVVSFDPLHMKEADVGQPLNQRAVEQYKLSNLTPTIPNLIKPNADLSEAINIGLKVCEFDKKEFEKTHK